VLAIYCQGGLLLTFAMGFNGQCVANVKTQPTPTTFCGVAIKETLEGFIHCPLFLLSFFPYKLIKFQLILLNKLQVQVKINSS
jgi:hypothetical protein